MTPWGPQRIPWRLLRVEGWQSWAHTWKIIWNATIELPQRTSFLSDCSMMNRMRICKMFVWRCKSSTSLKLHATRSTQKRNVIKTQENEPHMGVVKITWSTWELYYHEHQPHQIVEDHIDTMFMFLLCWLVFEGHNGSTPFCLINVDHTKSQ